MVATYVPGPHGPMVFASTAGGGGGTVLFDNASLQAPGGASVTTEALTFAVGGGSNGTANRALLAAVQFVNGTGVVSSVSGTFNGVSLGSSLGNIGNTTSGDIYLFGMINPPIGSFNIVFNWTGADQAIISALSVVGANQTGGTTTFHNLNTAVGTSALNSLGITAGSSGEMVFAAHVVDGNFVASGGTGVTDIGHNNGGNVDSGAANYATGSTTLTYSSSGGTGKWASIGCAIKAA